ncbi:MAG TPA: putative sulfate exporter family transporter, partial [Patescibacteria group bacterium]|nr:putative sulfate exporter family transporter [Patescibacteria group bacterium]
MTVVSATDGRQLAAPARAIVPGLILASILALVAGAVSGWLPPAIAPVTISILLGILVGQLPAARDQRLAPGLAFAAQRVLRLGIVLLGARLSFEQIARIGIPSTIVVVVTMAA